MLESLITSKTRIKLLLKFFLNPGTSAYLRGLAEEFGESTNAVRIELNRLSKAGLLKSRSDGRTKLYTANKVNPLFPEINNMVKKYLGIDIVTMAVERLGNLEYAFITGDYSKGIDTGIIDLVLVGNINKSYLEELIIIAEENIKRKIRPLVLNTDEFENLRTTLKTEKALILWSREKDGNIS